MWHEACVLEAGWKNFVPVACSRCEGGVSQIEKFGGALYLVAQPTRATPEHRNNG